MADSDPDLKVYTVAPGAPFLDTLADAVLTGALAGKTAPPAPLGLAEVRILLPNRRAARALATIFPTRTPGGAMLLPHISTLGDIDEDPTSRFAVNAPVPWNVVSDLERQIVLADIAREWSSRRGAAIRQPPDATGIDPVPRNAGEAAAFARDLGRLIDAMEAEDIDGACLAGILPEDRSHLAKNWALNLDFLTHALTRWASHLRNRGLVSRIAHRSAEADRFSARLGTEGSPHTIIAAGSTGSVPATARLLRAIAGLPNGAVVLPGLDFDLDRASWKLLRPDHPQYGLKVLLEAFGMEREQVRRLGISPDGLGTRARLVSEAMRPAETTGKWSVGLEGFAADETRRALEGVSLVVAANRFEEARVIALIMRAALEDPSATVALATPDRQLARAVRAELSRWRIDIDDSAGEALQFTAHGVFFQLLAETVLSGFSPVPTLGLLKHPLTRLLCKPAEIRKMARIIELVGLRGGRPEAGLEGLAGIFTGSQPSSRHPVLRRIKADDKAAALAVLETLSAATRPLTGLLDRSSSPAADELVHALIESAEAVAAVPQGEAPELWRGEAGEAMARFLADLSEAAGVAAPLEVESLTGWLVQLMAGQTVRRRGRGHRRLTIRGLLEARLLQADTVILAGLNEDDWPAGATTNPWLGRNMLAAIGLTPPERRVGLQAHDFIEGLLAPKVVLTRSEKTGGAPSVPSRWLWRLAALTKGLGVDSALTPDHPWVAWARGLDPAPPPEPCEPPRPAPPLAARPKSLSVTAIETWIRDPYAIYARHILTLEPLPAINQPPDARDYGTMIHDALARLLTQYPNAPLPPAAMSDLLRIGTGIFTGLDHRPGLRAFWWMRFERIAHWFVAEDCHLRKAGTQSACEFRGQLEINGPSLVRPFTLTARADRIDRMADGGVAIFDYKTGAPPSPKQVAKLLAPQMPLEAAILAQGGFEGLPGVDDAALAYIQLSGRIPPGRTLPLAGDPGDLARAAMEKLAGLVEQYAHPDTPYRSRVAPKMETYIGDFDHLARVKEWSLRTGKRHGG